MFLVEIFAGSHSVSRCDRRRFGESFDVRVLSVDNDPVSNPTILADINTWRYKRDIDDFLKQRRDNDIVACRCSPPCTAFSPGKHHWRARHPRWEPQHKDRPAHHALLQAELLVSRESRWFAQRSAVHGTAWQVSRHVLLLSVWSSLQKAN